MNPSMIRRSVAAAALAVAASAIGATAQYDTEPIAEPVEFEARWTGVDLREVEAWAIDGVDPTHHIGGVAIVEVETVTDPRMAGEVAYEYNDDEYRSVDMHLHHSSFRITNDDGAWQEVPALVLGHPDLRPSTRTGLFVGEGAYDGLVAVAELSWDRMGPAWGVRGYIIEGEIPPPPGEGTPHP